MTANKMVMISYNEAMDMEVMEILENCGLKHYSKITGTFGKGATSGTHLGNDIWTGRNNILYVGCLEKESQQLLSCIKELRKQLGHEGIKAFIMPVEDLS